MNTLEKYTVEQSKFLLSKIKVGDHVRIFDYYQTLHLKMVEVDGKMYGQLGLILWELDFCLITYPDTFRILGVYETEEDYYNSYEP